MISVASTIKSLIGGPSDFGFGWIIILISSLVTVLIVSINLFHWIGKRMSLKKRYLRKTRQLTVGMDIRNFEIILGTPIFINILELDQRNHTEYVFSNPFFYTQAITNSNNQVVLFSITTRSNNFNPSFRIGGSSITVTLGKTRFSELGLQPKKVFTHYDHGGVGFYSEIYYFGRPGHYLEYAFSMNINGPMVPDFMHDSFSEDPSEIATEKFQSKTPLNTYTVISSINVDDVSKLILGPRTGQIWNLND